MCVPKLDKKKLDEICAEAIKIDSGITHAEIANYEKRTKEKHYEPFNYEYVNWRGKKKKEQHYEPQRYDRDGT